MGVLDKLHLKRSHTPTADTSVVKAITMKLKPDTKYMIAIDHHYITLEDADALSKELKRLKVPNVIVLMEGDPRDKFYIIRQKPVKRLSQQLSRADSQVEGSQNAKRRGSK